MRKKHPFNKSVFLFGVFTTVHYVGYSSIDESLKIVIFAFSVQFY